MQNIICEIVNHPIDMNIALDACRSDEGGAVVFFVGTTRNNFEGKKVKKLFYEADEELALMEMHQICEEAIQKFDGLKASIIHRIGEVGVGEESIVCILTTPHREEGFKGCEYMMRDLKKRVPIWKKEIFEDNSSEWKENKV